MSCCSSCGLPEQHLRLELGESSFRLTFITKAILPLDIVFSISRVESFDETTSKEGLWASFDLINESITLNLANQGYDFDLFSHTLIRRYRRTCIREKRHLVLKKKKRCFKRLRCLRGRRQGGYRTLQGGSESSTFTERELNSVGSMP
ncbi:hypothetical protein BHM03_00009358 [Ensete ventricosum]|nr:hypothetical protein BHM03_00009358 [Ensete ventricosum]